MALVSDGWTLVFGYRHVSGVPTCPCKDPGNYLMMERLTGDPATVTHAPIKVRFRCWCGRTIEAEFDTAEEYTNFLTDNGVEIR